MTEERKNELLTSALKLIGTHMDEDENFVRALSEQLGMTAEEMRECGIEAADAPERDISALFEEKISAAFEEYQTSWNSMSREELIKNAEEIAVVQRMAKELPESVSENDKEYLLRFKNPLEVVSDAWMTENELGAASGALDHVLWEITDKQSAEVVYEMEPEYYETQPELTM